MIAALFDDLKLKVDAALKAMIVLGVVAAAATAAFICLAVALFLWTEQSYGLLEAWVVLGTLFVIVAISGALVFVVVRRRRLKHRAAQEKSVSRFLQDPAVILAGLQLVRILGVRRLVPLLAIGAIAAGLMLNRPHPANALADGGDAEAEA
jgi:predicted Kef-type K+ transport protein